MLNFFKKLFGRKYPEGAGDDDIELEGKDYPKEYKKKKKITGRVYAGPPISRKNMECVYAGPDMMDRVRRNSATEGAYAGPPRPEAPIAVPTPEEVKESVEEPEMECVYAGPPEDYEPEVIEEEVPEEPAEEETEAPAEAEEEAEAEEIPVEEEPEEVLAQEEEPPVQEEKPPVQEEKPAWLNRQPPIPDDMMKAVYAGPQLPDELLKPVDRPDRAPQVNLVYAGPARMSMQPVLTPETANSMLMAYAGPQQMSKGSIGMPGMQPYPPQPEPVQPEKPEPEESRYDDMYSNMYEQPGSYTGMPMTKMKADTEYKICPSCGWKNAAGSKFCQNCGNTMKDESKLGTLI
ncbi:MAG: zinc ribbon domain-containing protein [Lachnospiraceae bacterium]|nr:zinc ribbon domain-containing protein [Lachnospiraceae bacterium]